MDYNRIYQSLIERGSTRTVQDQYEIHHIIPRCLGGTDASTNLVKLTPEEHYVAHQLLVKMHPENPKLVKAAQMMIPNRPSNKLYGWLRRRFATVMSISQTGPGNSQYGTVWINNTQAERKIKKTDSLPDGWVLGRKTKTKPKIVELSSRDKKKLLDKERYSEYYKLYKEVGWTEFVNRTGYKFSKQNFVMICARLLKEFVPQNGKKRGVKS